MQDLVKLVQDGVNNGDPLIIAGFITFIVIALTILIFAVGGRSNNRRGVLVLGLCDAGKTLLFTQLVHKKFSHTHTSIKENRGMYELSGNKRGKSLKLIDLPGHERIRLSMVDKYKSDARGLLFVVDSVTFQKDVKDVAEFVYTLLIDPILSSHVPPVLIACNKHDQTMAKASKIIQANMEKEINTLRVTRSAKLSVTDNVANNNTFLGKRNKDFTFSDAKPFNIKFVECSARGEKDDVNPQVAQVEEWLELIA